MKIECPSCHLAGNINEEGLPPEGRLVNCPRCKNGFQVAKPLDTGEYRRPMSSCPSCQYSTFTDETFTVCPKCGMTADEFEALSRKRESEQLKRNQEVLDSYRTPEPGNGQKDEAISEPSSVPQPVRMTAWGSIGVGVALLCYGLFGLVTYYRTDWQAVLSAPLLEPVSKLSVFFSLGFLPWLVTLFSIYLVWAASEFLRLRQDAENRLTESALAGIAVVVIYGIAEFVAYMKISSSTPSFSYYATGILSSAFMMALLGTPFAALYWYLENGTIIRQYKKAQRLSRIA